MNVNDPVGPLKDAGTRKVLEASASRVPRILLGLFLLTFFGIFIVQISRSSPQKVDWRTLPSGGAIRLHSVTVGTTHSVPVETVTFGSKLQQSLRLMSPVPFFASTRSGTMSMGRAPSTVFWFLFNDRNSRSLNSVDLILPDGQVFRSHGSSDGSSGNTAYSGHTFGFVAYTSPKLRLSADVEGQRMEWEVDNPGYNPDVPEWTPETLPAVRTLGEYQFTLESLAAKRTSSSSKETWIQPKTKVTKDGKPVKGISVGFVIRDPAGNEFYGVGLYSSKAWKLVPRFQRTNDFQFKDDEVQWIGNVNTDSIPAPEKVNTLPLSEAVATHGVLAVGTHAPGIYEYRGLELINTKPFPAGSTSPALTTDYDYNKNVVRVKIGKPALVTFAKTGNRVIFFRNPEGKPIDAKNRYYGHAGSDRSVEIHSIDGPMRVGVADSRIPGVKDDDIEIIVSPPPMPETK